jgi:hypothetical protein
VGSSPIHRALRKSPKGDFRLQGEEAIVCLRDGLEKLCLIFEELVLRKWQRCTEVVDFKSHSPHHKSTSILIYQNMSRIKNKKSVRVFYFAR